VTDAARAAALSGNPRIVLPSFASRRLGPLVFIAFSISGCAGLIYQSIWAQYLGLFLGHAAYAQSLVLAIFMGGMAAGAWRASVRTPRRRNLLRAYAWIELCIGIAALVFHPLYAAATQFAYESAFPALGGGSASSLFKWGLSAALILPQSILLGATFPLMSNALMRRLPYGNGAILSGLYFTNSLGAAFGALLATFVLLPAVGLPGAMAVGAVLNLAVSAIAFTLARDDEPAQAAGTIDIRAALPVSLLLWSAAFITGATSFAYEIGWVRMLSLVFGSTVHAFELMLAAFIGGLACGGLWIRRRLDGYGQLLAVGGYVQILMGIAALASLVLYDHAFDWVAWCVRVFPRTAQGYTLFNLATAASAMLIMAPTAFFAGMTLPIFTLQLIRRGGGEASVGRIYAANTVGAIVGIFATVHLLVPTLGLKVTMIVAAAGDLALGIFLLNRAAPSAHKPVYAALLTCAIAVAAVASFAHFDPMAMAAGVYRSGMARLDSSSASVIFYRDGKTASIASTQLRDGSIMIATNGKVDASIQMRADAPPSIDEVTMTMSAILPLATHPAPHSAAVIGFGSGLTTQILLGDPRLNRVDTIEIEPTMVEGARVFAARVKRAFDDPRSVLIFDDAKAFFAASQSRYDIIVSEPSNPWVSGVASLFSQEFYRFIPRHLTSDGVFVQWIQDYGINDELVATIGNTLANSFADFRVYLTSDFDLLLIATPTGSLDSLHDDALREPALADELHRVGLVGRADFSIRQVGDRQSLLPLFDKLSLRSNSDFYPILSLEAPRARFINSRARALLGLNTADIPIREVLAGLQPPAPEQLSPGNGFTPAELTRQAMEIAAALSETEPIAGNHDPNIFGAIQSIRSDFATCDGGGAATQQIDVLIALAGRTIPFLDADHLRGIWSDPRWINCTGQPESLRSQLALLSALGSRDFALAGSTAVTFLQKSRQDLSPMAQDWLLRVAMLSAIAGHRYEDVARLDVAEGRTIARVDTTGVQRDYLVAFANSQLHRHETTGSRLASRNRR